MHQVLELGPAYSDQEEGFAHKFSSGPRFGGRLKPAMDHMAERYAAGEQLVIVSRQTARLMELWGEARLELPSDTPFSKLPAPVFIEGSLAEGWVYTPQDQRGYHLLTDGEIFGWRRPEPRQRHRPIAEAPEAAYADLQIGSLVVHVDHGIGLFQGLVRRTVENNKREYLCIEYAENDQLFVPVYQADHAHAILDLTIAFPHSAGWAALSGAIPSHVRKRLSKRSLKICLSCMPNVKLWKVSPLRRTHPGKKSWKGVSPMLRPKIN